MQTIACKYLGPTNFKGSRVKATATNGESITVAYQYELGFEGTCCEVATDLKNKLGWSGVMYGGHTRDGMVFVFANNLYKIEG